MTKRRGRVFGLRLTPVEERNLREAVALSGPRTLGAWVRWAALERAAVQPARGGSAVQPDLVSTTVEPSRGRTAVKPAPASTTVGRDRLILDLCGGSGAWSAPYVAAGYQVEVVTLATCGDVRYYEPPPGVWGVLAAPPCEQFSLAKNGHPRDLARGLETVCGCLRAIALARPKWWALENPVGLLSRWLGSPRDVFEPCDFGDPWTKRTALWGDFTTPRRVYCKPQGSGPPCFVHGRMPCDDRSHRAMASPAFARRFFESNP